MGFAIDNHFLTGDFGGIDVVQDHCDGKDSGNFTGDRPDTIVIHFTAGPTLLSAVNTLKNPDVKASAHLVIDTNGSTSQLISFNKIAWHAGKSSWQDRSQLNNYSIGIELVNAGELKRSGSQYVSWFGKRYEENQVMQARHQNQSAESFWHVYSEEQIGACFEVCRSLKANYPIDFILGHEEISPGRKTDPGPAFPLEKLRDQILIGRGDTHLRETIKAESDKTKTLEKAEVIVGKLNFRQQPYTGSRMAGDPLSFGDKVELLEKRGSWRKVRVSAEGWVHGDYLKISENS